MPFFSGLLSCGRLATHGADRPNRRLPEVQRQTEDSAVAEVDKQERVARQYRSHGEAHSKFVRLGIQQAKLRRVAQVTKAHHDDRSNLVRAVFGDWQHKATASGTYKSQSKAIYTNKYGSIDIFDFNVNCNRSLARQKALGVWSHVCAQISALKRWMQKSPARTATVSWQHSHWARGRDLGLGT